jgi:hypothetical protein
VDDRIFQGFRLLCNGQFESLNQEYTNVANAEGMTGVASRAMMGDKAAQRWLRATGRGNPSDWVNKDVAQLLQDIKTGELTKMSPQDAANYVAEKVQGTPWTTDQLMGFMRNFDQPTFNYVQQGMPVQNEAPVQQETPATQETPAQTQPAPEQTPAATTPETPAQPKEPGLSRNPYGDVTGSLPPGPQTGITDTFNPMPPDPGNTSPEARRAYEQAATAAQARTEQAWTDWLAMATDNYEKTGKVPPDVLAMGQRFGLSDEEMIQKVEEEKTRRYPTEQKGEDAPTGLYPEGDARAPASGGNPYALGADVQGASFGPSMSAGPSSPPPSTGLRAQVRSQPGSGSTPPSNVLVTQTPAGFTQEIELDPGEETQAGKALQAAFATDIPVAERRAAQAAIGGYLGRRAPQLQEEIKQMTMEDGGEWVIRHSNPWVQGMQDAIAANPEHMMQFLPQEVMAQEAFRSERAKTNYMKAQTSQITQQLEERNKMIEALGGDTEYYQLKVDLLQSEIAMAGKKLGLTDAQISLAQANTQKVYADIMLQSMMAQGSGGGADFSTWMKMVGTIGNLNMDDSNQIDFLNLMSSQLLGINDMFKLGDRNFNPFAGNFLGRPMELNPEMQSVMETVSDPNASEEDRANALQEFYNAWSQPE